MLPWGLNIIQRKNRCRPGGRKDLLHIEGYSREEHFRRKPRLQYKRRGRPPAVCSLRTGGPSDHRQGSGYGPTARVRLRGTRFIYIQCAVAEERPRAAMALLPSSESLPSPRPERAGGGREGRERRRSGE